MSAAARGNRQGSCQHFSALGQQEVNNSEKEEWVYRHQKQQREFSRYVQQTAFN